MKCSHRRHAIRDGGATPTAYTIDRGRCQTRRSLHTALGVICPTLIRAKVCLTWQRQCPEKYGGHQCEHRRPSTTPTDASVARNVGVGRRLTAAWAVPMTSTVSADRALDDYTARIQVNTLEKYPVMWCGHYRHRLPRPRSTNHVLSRAVHRRRDPRRPGPGCLRRLGDDVTVRNVTRSRRLLPHHRRPPGSSHRRSLRDLKASCLCHV